MATSYVDYDGDGNATKAFTFPSLTETDVKVEVDGTIKTVTTHYNITGYSTTGGGNIVFTAGNIPATGTNIRIYRDTDVSDANGEYDPQATFSAGSSVKAGDLNLNQKQALYAIWEEKEQTIVTTDIKDNAVTSAKILGNAVNSAHIADGAVGSSEIAGNAVNSAHIADNAVGSSEIAANAVGSTQIADNSVISSKIAGNAVGSAQIADGAVGSSEIAGNAVNSAHIADGAVGSSEIAGDAVGSAQIADGAVGSSEIAANAVGSAQIADGAVGSSEIAGDAVGSAQIADGAVGSSEIAGNAINSTHIADGAVGSSEIVGNAINSAHIADGAVGSSELDANSVGNVQMKDNAITMTEIGCEETTITDDDTKLPTSGAVVDYVAAQLSNVGGLVVKASELHFPATADQPVSGIVISIADAGGVVVNGSGVSTTGRTTDGTPATVTINGFPSSLYNETLAAGVGLQVSSTGSSNTYTYHKLLATETDVKQLSDDINDFNSRYRIASSSPGSNNDEGDLYFDTSANKMYVYDGSAWGQVTSTGEFLILGVKDNGQAHNGTGPTFNGSNDQYDLFEGTSDANITQAAQLTVVLNGVQQKPNDGSWSGSNEGFHLDGADGIRFCDPPPSGSTLFVIKSGSATEIAVPADNSVTAGKTDISLVQGDIIYANGTDSWTRLAKGTAGQVLKINSGATAPEWGSTFTTITEDGSSGDITFETSHTDGSHREIVWDKSDGDFTGGKDVTFKVGNARMFENSDTNAVFGTSAGNKSVYIDSSSAVRIGSSSTSSDDHVAFFRVPIGGTSDDGYVKLYYTPHGGSPSDRIETTSTGTTFKKDVFFDNSTNDGKDITWDESNNHLVFQDSVACKFGGGGDFSIYHDGTNTTLTNTTGDIYLTDQGGNIYIQAKANEQSIVAFADGAVELFYDNTKELGTKAGGVKLYGHSEQVINTLTSASSVTIDFSLANIHTITMGHNVTFPDPSNESVGQSGSIILTQDGTGGRTADWSDAAWRFVGGNAPTLSTAAGAVDRIDYLVVAAGNIHCVASLDVK